MEKETQKLDLTTKEGLFLVANEARRCAMQHTKSNPTSRAYEAILDAAYALIGFTGNGELLKNEIYQIAEELGTEAYTI